MRYFVAGALVVLAGCSASDPIDNTFNPQVKAEKKAARERAADARAVKAGFAPDAPKPLATVSLDPPGTPAPGAVLPPAEAQYRYIGRWASSAAQCEAGAWEFKSRQLETPEKTGCDLPDVSQGPSEYKLHGTCKGTGRKLEQTVTLSFDERRRTMHVASPTLGASDLIYCGN